MISHRDPDPPVVFIGAEPDRRAPSVLRARARLVAETGTEVTLKLSDRDWRNVNLAVRNVGNHVVALAPCSRLLVQLEVGSARMTPSIERPMSSFV